MIEVRRAVADDAVELTRLREHLFAGMDGVHPEPAQWQQDAVAALRKLLPETDGEMAAFVVAAPDAPARLASCAIGVIDTRLPSPHNRTGETGYVMSVATDPDYRRRGYSRACMRALLGWFGARRVQSVMLNASSDGEPLYTELGFAFAGDPQMRLKLPATDQ
ncbi:MAG TPA: GNAT family N-acetyltransferase [Pseudonocardiaceae bacterium]